MNKKTLTLAVVIAAGCCLLRPMAAPSEVKPQSRSTARTQSSFKPIGSMSCSARSCHGGALNARDLFEPNSLRCYSLWLNYDPHAGAYQTLTSETSANIMKALGASTSATTDVRCLACHSNPASVLDGKVVNRAANIVQERERFGTGCESCHGAAESWLVPHTTLDWYKEESRRERADQHGLNWMKDLQVRAQTCTGCHVGAPADAARNLPVREVTHDMIAGGHPRLNFEFVTYEVNLPPHWFERESKVKTTPATRKRAEVARSWITGQLVAAQAALELRQRHVEADEFELADYDCYACHHNLAATSWRQPRVKAGPLTWNPWYQSAPLRRLMPQLASTTEDATAALCELDNVRRPSTGKVAEVLQQGLRLVREKSDEQIVQMMIDSLAVEGVMHWNWDDACQFYHAASAVEASKRQAALEEELARLTQKHLTFPVPEEQNGKLIHFSSPWTFRGDRAELLDLLSKVHRLLNN